MSERVKTDDQILDGIINSIPASIIVPPRLVLELTELVSAYAALHRETPDACCRGVEIAVLQRGIRAVREELKANGRLGVAMGWNEKEEENAT